MLSDFFLGLFQEHVILSWNEPTRGVPWPDIDNNLARILGHLFTRLDGIEAFAIILA